MIIPIIFRGEISDLPSEIKAATHFADFSKFTTADPDISKNQEYVEKIDDIAKHIYEHYRSCEGGGSNIFSECPTFQLPAEEDTPRWFKESTRHPLPFPGREIS